MNRARHALITFLFTLAVLVAINPPGSVGAQEMPILFPDGDIETLIDFVLERRGDLADVYYPAKPTSLEGFPVVAVLQGAGVDKSFYAGFGKQLARFGFVVVIPNHFQEFVPPQPAPPVPVSVIFPDQDVILDVFEQMVEEDINPSEMPAGIVDSTRMGLVGHSAGGAASLFAIERSCQFPFCGPPPPFPPPPFFPLPDAVRAGAFYGTNTCGAGGDAEDPACFDENTNEFSMIFSINNENIPVALVQGSVDGISTPPEADATFAVIDGLRELIAIDGANHYGITDENNPEGAVPDFSPPDISQSQSIQEIVDAMGPFLRTYLVITVDNVSNATAQTQKLTWSHTVAAGNDQLLMVGTSHIDQNRPVTVDGVTYGDIPLTRLGVQPDGHVRMEMWYLIAPHSGTADIVVSLSNKGKIVGGAVSFNGVDQETPFGVFMSAEGMTATASVTVASGPRELVFTVVATSGDAKSLTVDDGQTQLWNTGTGKHANDIRGAGSSVPEGSLVTMTLGKKKSWAIGAVPLKPADAP